MTIVAHLGFLLPLALLQAASDDAQQPAAPAAGAKEQGQPSIPPYEGTLTEGLDALERLSKEGNGKEALALAESLLAPTDFLRWRSELEQEDSKVIAPLLDVADPALEWLGLNGWPEPLRAEVHYSVGLVHLSAKERADAESAFARARALAGPGELRLSSMYNRGAAALEEGEALREQIPELQGAAPAPAAPAPPSAAASAPEGVDPLQLARAAYIRAREHLIERLRADWRDADTRANVELVQRRLKELDEIERERQEQQQEQQQQEQEENEQQDQQQDSPQQDPGSPEDSEEQKDPQQDPQSKDPEQPPPPQDPKDSPQDEASEPPKPDDEKPEETAGEQQEQAPQEIYLTQEEMQRLLEMLRAHEEEGKVVRQRLHQNARKSARRDW